MLVRFTIDPDPGTANLDIEPDKVDDGVQCFMTYSTRLLASSGSCGLVISQPLFSFKMHAIHFFLIDLVLATVIETSSSFISVTSPVFCYIDSATVSHIVGDSRGTKRVIAEVSFKSSRFGPSSHHVESVASV